MPPGLLLALVLLGTLPAAEPPIRSTQRIALPAGETTLDAVREAFAKAGRPIAFPSDWDGKRKLTLAPTAPETAIAALDRVARAVGGRIVLEDRGNVLKLAAAAGPMNASTDGDFRTAVQEIAARLNPDTGQRTLEVTLVCHWEPSFCVVRIDGEATLTEVILDVGKTAHTAAKTKAATRDSQYLMTLRFPNVPREAKTISLKGRYAVTAAQAMQTITFDATKPMPQTLPGPLDADVSATLLPLRELPDRREAIVELTYPPSTIEFESFESALRFTRNRLTLVGSDGKPIRPLDDDLRESPNKTTLVYRFAPSKADKDRASLKAVVVTPTRFHEFPVHFDLPGVPLP